MTGTYTDIVQVIVPGSAVPGERITIEAQVKSLHSGNAIAITVTGDINGTDIYFGNKAYWVPYGVTASFYQPFIMPSADAVIWVWSWYKGVDGEWYEDDSVKVTVSVAGTGINTGEIVSKWVNKSPEGNLLLMPAVVNPDGNTFEVGIRYKNTSVSAITAGCEVKVWDPVGLLRASPAVDYTGMSPNEESTKEYNICPVDKSGYWTVHIRFVMSDGTELARFEGSCLSAAVVAGEIISQWVNKATEGNLLPMPASVAANSDSFEIGVSYRNDSDLNIRAGCKVEVWDPNGVLRTTTIVDYTGMDPGESLSKQYNICPVDKAGAWTTRITFLTEDGNVIDIYEGTCLNAVGLVGTIVSKWINKAPEGNYLPLPAYVEADEHTFEIGIQYQNTSVFTIIAGCKVEVWDPDGTLRAAPVVDWTGMSPEETLIKQYNACSVDKAGDWTIKIEFLTDDGAILDTFEGVCLVATAEAVVAFSDLTIQYFRVETGTASTGQQVAVAPGDTLQVVYSFMYTTVQQANVELWSSLYIFPGRDYTVKETVALVPGTNVVKEGTINMPISDNVGLKNRTYDLLLEIPDAGLQATEEQAIIVSGMTEGLLGGIGDVAELVGMLIVMMMMSMMMNIMGSPEGIIPAAKEYYEKGRELAQPVIQIFTGGEEPEE